MKHPDDFNQAIEQYRHKWAALVPKAAHRQLFEDLLPTALGWKVGDIAEHDAIVAAWRDKADQIHSKWMNDRWITILYLHEPHQLAWGIRTLKVLQRRPGVTDALGLDHVDFYSPKVAGSEKNLLAAEPNLHTTDEENGPCKWISVWFEGTEAKLRSGTTLGVCATELLEADEEIKASATQKNSH
jgi:hypothetical protein